MSKPDREVTLVDLKLATVRWYQTEGMDRAEIKRILLDHAEDLQAPPDMIRDIENLPVDG